MILFQWISNWIYLGVGNKMQEIVQTIQTIKEGWILFNEVKARLPYAKLVLYWYEHNVCGGHYNHTNWA